jgi:hypothetical protein
MQIGSLPTLCRHCLTAAPLLLLPLAAPAQAQENFYVDFQLQSGHYAPPGNETIVGNITLAPGTTGLVPDSAITGFSFSSTAGDPFAFSTSGSVPSGILGPGLFTVQGNDLLFTPLPWVPSSPCTTCDNNPYQVLSFGTTSYLDFQGPGLTGFPAATGGAGSSPPGVGVRFEGNSAGWILSPGTVIGTLAAPEISTQGAWPAVTLLVGGLAILRGRRRGSL